MMIMLDIRIKPIRNLIRNHNRNILPCRQIPQHLSQLDQLPRPRRQRINIMRGMLRTEIRRDGINHDQSHIIPRDGDRKLVVEDMLLRLKVHGVDG